jgi:hypothetical protein
MQLREPEPHPTLDGSRRDAQPERDLLVREAAEESEPE